MNPLEHLFEKHRAYLELSIDGGFIANDMTPSELWGRLLMEMRSWEMVRNSSDNKE